MEQSLTLEEAARRFGVTRRRVQAMVTSGSLPAEKRGSQWFVHAGDVRMADHNRDPRPGRPLAAATAWALIKGLADQGRRLASERQLDNLRRRLRPRATHLSYYVHPGLLDSLRSRDGVVLGGRDAVGETVPVDRVDVDLYVRSDLTEGLLDSVTARRTSANANVFVHVVDDEAWPFSPGQRHVDPWVAWLDLEDRQDRAAVSLLDRLIGGRIRA